MNERELFPLLEEALRAQLATRCRRAYHHDMKNGLQGIYGGVDALIRAARADKPLSVPLDQLVQFVRHAISNHESGLERVLNNIAPDAESSGPIDVAELVIELTRFLMTDAGRVSVRMRSELAGPLQTTTNTARLRLAFLGLLTEAIDSMPGGGEISISGRMSDAGIQIVMSDARASAASVRDAFVLDLNAQPLRTGIVLPTIRYILTSLGGTVECTDVPEGRRTTVQLPIA